MTINLTIFFPCVYLVAIIMSFNAHSSIFRYSGPESIEDQVSLALWNEGVSKNTTIPSTLGEIGEEREVVITKEKFPEELKRVLDL